MTEDNNKEVHTEQQEQVENGTSKVENGEAKVENGENKVENGDSQQNVEETKEMRTIVISGTKSIKVIKKPEPTIQGDDEVLIRVQAAGLSFNDLLCKQGNFVNLPKTPFTGGFEAAGIVESVGQNVDLKVGDRVAALTSSPHCWSELVSVNSKYVYKLPDGIDFENAVALTLNYVFAHYLLFEIVNLKANDSIFIQCCSGGVGNALVNLASTIENVTIIGTASKAKHEKIEGVKHLFDHSDDILTEVKKILPEGVNLVFDCLNGENVHKMFGVLQPLGHYIMYGTTSSNSGLLSAAKSWFKSFDKVKLSNLFEENKTLSGFSLRQFLFTQNGHDHVRKTVEKIYNLFLDGKIKPVIDSRFAFEDVADALLQLHERKNIGKVLLIPSLEPKPRPVEEEPVKKSRFGSKSSKKADKEADKKVEKKEEQNGFKENGDVKENADEPKLNGDDKSNDKVTENNDVKDLKENGVKNEEATNEPIKVEN